MLTKFITVNAYELTTKKLTEYEDTYNISHLKGAPLDHYEHLRSMSEYLFDSIQLGASEVLLNVAEVDSLVKKII